MRELKDYSKNNILLKDQVTEACYFYYVYTIYGNAKTKVGTLIRYVNDFDWEFHMEKDARLLGDELLTLAELIKDLH